MDEAVPAGNARISRPKADLLTPDTSMMAADERLLRQARMMWSISLVLGSMGLLSTLFIFYYFLKVRRSFRQDMIILLIVSDFIKSLTFVTFPIVSFLRGPIASDSAFCQFSGFALEAGFEASDMAILIMALHTLLYIIRPQRGLFPFRKAAFAAYISFPLVMASLAFVQGQGYVNLGQYCYLSDRPNWVRVALSWVPRYVFIFIVVMVHAFVYFYVVERMNAYRQRSDEAYQQITEPQEGHTSSPVRTVPRIAHHGLLPSTPHSGHAIAFRATPDFRDSGNSGASQLSASTMGTLLSRLSDSLDGKNAAPASEASRPSAVSWTWVGFEEESGNDCWKAGRQGDIAALSVTSRVGPLQELASPHWHAVSDLPAIPIPIHTQDAADGAFFYHQPLMVANCLQGHHDGESCSSTRHALSADQMPLMAILKSGPLNVQMSRALAASPSLRLTRATPKDIQTQVNKNRVKTRKQLRGLFIHPAVYVVVWTFPFVSHILGLKDKLSKSDPMWLMAMCVISLTCQSVVDSLIFGVRERPWQLLANPANSMRSGSRSNGRLWKKVRQRMVNHKTSHGVGGRSREEMRVDGTIARARRDEEIAQEWLRDSLPSKRGGPKEWWEADAFQDA